jgi:5'-methylthioadenosine phosphorylase
MTKAVLGIIGGSGIYDLPGLEKVRQRKIKSPWGEPSAALRVGEIAGTPVAFLSRHDKGHRLSPSDINYRANIDVLKRAGVTDLVSLSACGSFKQELPPGTFVLVDQFVDRTHSRAARSSARVASRTCRWRIRSRRCCRIASQPRPARRTSSWCAAAPYICMEGPAVLQLRREHDLQGARLFRDRHDQSAGGEARARGGALLRDRGRW